MKGYQKYGHDASCLKTIITTKKENSKTKKETQQNKKRKKKHIADAISFYN